MKCSKEIVKNIPPPSLSNFNNKEKIEDVPKHVVPNLVFADDDQQRSRPGRLAKASGLRPPAFASWLYDPSG